MNPRFVIAVALFVVVPSLAAAQGKTVKIGVLNDQSTVYSDSQGIESVIAARMAVEDYAKNLGLNVESSSPITRTRLISAPISPAAGTGTKASR